VLLNFLNGSLSKNPTNNAQNVIFTFGFNLSPQKAVDIDYNCKWRNLGMKKRRDMLSISDFV